MLSQKLFALLFVTSSAQEGSGQHSVEDVAPQEPVFVDFARGRPNFGRPTYDDYEDSDLGTFFLKGGPLTTCRVGSYANRDSPPSPVDCAADEVCQITFEYRKERGGAFTRFFRAMCKEQKTCEDNMHSNNLCKGLNIYGRQSIAHCVSCCMGNTCDSFAPYEGSDFAFTDFTDTVVTHHV